jgi:hypothetical protein
MVLPRLSHLSSTIRTRPNDSHLVSILILATVGVAFGLTIGLLHDADHTLVS